MEHVKPVRLGLVGCGMMGSHYADVFSKMDGVEITSCCDPTPSKLKNFGKIKGIEHLYPDFRSMMETESIDGILNVTQDSVHATVAESALNAGLPLLTEKPLSGTLEEAVYLKNLSDRGGTPVMVNFSKRHSAAVATARKLIQANYLGNVNRIEVSYRQGWVYTRDWGDWEKTHSWTWRLDKSFSPLGVLADLGSHIIDLVRYVTGKEFTAVLSARCMTVDKGTSRIGHYNLNSPDFAEAMLELNSSIPVSFLSSRIDIGRTDDVRMDIYGSSGSLRFNLGKNRRAIQVRLCEPDNNPLPDGIRINQNHDSSGDSTPDTGWKTLGCDRPKSNYQRFIDVIRFDSPPSPSIDDGLAVQQTLEAIYLSAGSNETTTPIAYENLRK